MSVYLRKMVGTRWKTIQVSDEEVENITKDYFRKNLVLMERCILNVNLMCEKSEKLKSAQLTHEMRDKMAISLMDKMVSPLHYAIENYVEDNLSKETDL